MQATDIPALVGTATTVPSCDLVLIETGSATSAEKPK